MKKAGKGTALKQKRTWKQEVQHNWPLYVLILPSFVLAIIFCYVPMGGLVMAFQDYKPWLGITGSQFVGMDNFRQIFEFKESYQAIINTLIIAVSKIILGLIVPIIMALLLNEVHNIGLKKGIQTLVYLPHFLSWVTVAGMLRDILGTVSSTWYFRNSVLIRFSSSARRACSDRSSLRPTCGRASDLE